MKIGKYDVTIKDGDNELTELPQDLPVFDFEGNEVTLEEARAGNLRQSDYTKKTQEVAPMKKLLEEMGVPAGRGVNIVRHLLTVVNELEEQGLELDPSTGEILKLPGQGAGDLGEGNTGDQVTLPPAIAKQLKEIQQRLGAQEQDIGALLGIISKRDIETAFPDLSETHLEWVYGMARDNPEKSPMEFAKALNDELEAWGQKTIDEHALQKEELKKQELERVPGKEGLEMFGEDVKFSFDPSRHGEDAKVVSPSEAAKQFMEAALKDEE